MIRRTVDMHCHIMPGVDDGASTRKEVQEMLKMEYRDGVRVLVLTPHYRKGMFEPEKDLIKKRFRYVQYEVEQLGLDMKVFLGCEYHANTDMIKDLRLNSHFRINGSEYVLIEFSSMHTYAKVRNWIYDLVNAGFKPIIAHLERYQNVTKNIENVQELIELGAYVQVSSGAFVGEDGLKAMWIARNLLKKGLVHFVGSDAHNVTDRAPNLRKCMEYIEKKEGREYAKNLFINNPKKILDYKD